MFISVNNGKNEINLKNVSNIRILDKYNKVFFNMNYSVQIEKRGNLIWVSDYVECNYDAEEMERLVTTLKLNSYLENNFMEYDSGFINKNSISSIKYEPQKYKVCVNLNNHITQNNEFCDIVTSSFVFINANTDAEYQYNKDKIKSALYSVGG